jgi:hypothetical protein
LMRFTSSSFHRISKTKSSIGSNQKLL